MNETGLVYQPSLSGAREAEASTDGPLASYFSENAPPDAEFPAASVQLPETEAPEESGPE